MIPPKVIATCFALTGFAATAIAGVYVGNPATATLVRAMLVMIASWVVGLAIGAVMNKAVRDHVDAFKASHPLPDVEAAASGNRHDTSTEPSPAAATEERFTSA